MTTFLDNFRAATQPSVQNAAKVPKQVQNYFNDITFRDANQDEPTGIQKIKLRMPNNKVQEMFLVVPEKDTIEYGYITPNAPDRGEAMLFSGAPDKSEYSGPRKAVGLSMNDDRPGTVMGAILPSGETLNAKGAEDFLNGLGRRGVKVIGNEQPEQKQEHTGPDYVPGDIILSALGMGRKTGAAGFYFKRPEEHKDYQTFLKKLREAGDRGR